MKKYKLITAYDAWFQHSRLYRIEALKDFGNIKKGDLGGYVESEDNLSHATNCWIYDNISVYGNSIIQGNAIVRGIGQIHGNYIVGGSSILYLNRNIIRTRERITLKHGYWRALEINGCYQYLISNTLELK